VAGSSRPPRTQFNDRMSDSDALMWRIESDPALRSTIVSMWVLDQAPDWDRFHEKLEQTAADIPRLRERVVEDALGLASPSWEPDPHFDLSFHIRRLNLPPGSSLRVLLDAAQPIGMQSFDRDRPLWELHVFEGLAEGRVGVVMKLHHAISDGVGLVRMTEGMIERSRDAGAGVAPEGEVAPALRTPSQQAPRTELARLRAAAGARARSRLDRAGRLAGAVRSTFLDLMRSPVDTVKGVSEGVRSLGRLMAPVTQPLSPVLTGRSLSNRFDTIFLPLADLKGAGKAAGGSVNDAFVSAVAGGLRRYHEHFGACVEELRMNMPINMREGEKGKQAGNQFMPVRFRVPLGIADPAERIREVRRRVGEQRAEPALPLIDEISSVIVALPADGASRFSGLMMKAIDFTTSNVPGPRFPVYMSGARVEHTFGFGPLAGAALNVTCFSYDGELAIGINADPAAVTDPALLVECLRKGFDEVLAIA
jgi:diacylglycerol O-acyltransferase